jgi:hypothetical protein
MEVRVDSKQGPKVLAPAAMVDHLAAQLRLAQPEWLRQLAAEPGRFADLEVAVHQAFQQHADQLVASLLAQATQQSPALDAAKKK